GNAFGQHVLGITNLFGLDRDVRRLTLHAAHGGLVHQDTAVGQREPFARGSRAQQELTHGGGDAQTDGSDVAVDVLHRVVNRESAEDNAAGRVDVQADVPVPVLRFEQQEFSADPVGGVLVHFGAQEDNALTDESLG